MRKEACAIPVMKRIGKRKKLPKKFMITPMKRKMAKKPHLLVYIQFQISLSSCATQPLVLSKETTKAFPLAANFSLVNRPEGTQRT